MSIRCLVVFATGLESEQSHRHGCMTGFSGAMNRGQRDCVLADPFLATAMAFLRPMLIRSHHFQRPTTTNCSGKLHWHNGSECRRDSTRKPRYISFAADWRAHRSAFALEGFAGTASAVSMVHKRRHNDGFSSHHFSSIMCKSIHLMCSVIPMSNKNTVHVFFACTLQSLNAAALPSIRSRFRHANYAHLQAKHQAVLAVISIIFTMKIRVELLCMCLIDRLQWISREKLKMQINTLEKKLLRLHLASNNTLTFITNSSLGDMPFKISTCTNSYGANNGLCNNSRNRFYEKKMKMGLNCTKEKGFELHMCLFRNVIKHMHTLTKQLHYLPSEIDKLFSFAMEEQILPEFSSDVFLGNRTLRTWRWTTSAWRLQECFASIDNRIVPLLFVLSSR